MFYDHISLNPARKEWGRRASRVTHSRSPRGVHPPLTAAVQTAKVRCRHYFKYLKKRQSCHKGRRENFSLPLVQKKLVFPTAEKFLRRRRIFSDIGVFSPISEHFLRRRNLSDGEISPTEKSLRRRNISDVGNISSTRG